MGIIVSKEVEAEILKRCGLAEWPQRLGRDPAGQPVKLTEAEFTKDVIQLAHLYDWKVAHFRPGLTKSGKWITAVQGDGKGFPDLVLVRERHPVAPVIFMELKVPPNKTTPEQEQWIHCPFLIL